MRVNNKLVSLPFTKPPLYTWSFLTEIPSGMNLPPPRDREKRERREY